MARPMAASTAAQTAEAPQEEAQKIVEKEVTFDSEGVTLSATVWERDWKLPEPEEGKKPKKVKEGDPEAPPRAFVLLVHGLLSDRREFGELGPRLAQEAGVGVLALDLKGHGKSGGARGVISLESIVADINAAKEFLRGRVEQWDLKPQQWGVVGHSLGALGALKAGYNLHQECEIVAVAPPRTIREEIGPMKRLGYALAYRATGDKPGKDGVGRTLPYDVDYADIIENKNAREKARKIGFLQKRIPLRDYPALMEVEGEDIARNLMNPNVTVLVPTRDKVVRPEASRAVYEALPTSKRLWEIEGSGHSVFMDARATHTIDRLVDLLKPRLGHFPEVRPGHIKR